MSSYSATDPFAPLLPARTGAFEAAARHSRRVRRLRVALPVAALAMAVGLVGLGILTRIEISLSIGDLKITADGLAMDAPRLSGSDGKGRTYTVTATSAVQDLANPKIIRLNRIEATVVQPDGSHAAFSAVAGTYDAGGQTLKLDDGITIRASDGSAADLQRAEIDLTTGEVQSDAAVAFSSKLGAIEAKAMAVGERGGSVTFTDGVKMTVDPNAAGSSPFGSPATATRKGEGS